MSTSKVYFADFRTGYGGENMTDRLVRLMRTAGADEMELGGKFVAIKMHFGERGNLSYLRPNYAKAVVNYVKSRGGIPFLTDCNTMYPGARKNAVEHLECAWENGFSPLSVGCPIIIGDGLRGTDEIAVEVEGGEYVKKALIGRAVMDADVIISLSHFKGHEMAGFGGAVKNIGMGCGSRAGKKDMHANGKPLIDEDKCIGCRVCFKECANDGLSFDESAGKMRLSQANCVGCGRCVTACPTGAVALKDENAPYVLGCKMAEYTKAVVNGREHFHISLVMDVSPFCDCHGENDAPIIADVGMFASFDPVALDKACADACMAAEPLHNSLLHDNIKDGRAGCDHFRTVSPESQWEATLVHGEKIGLGSMKYELVRI